MKDCACSDERHARAQSFESVRMSPRLDLHPPDFKKIELHMRSPQCACSHLGLGMRNPYIQTETDYSRAACIWLRYNWAQRRKRDVIPREQQMPGSYCAFALSNQDLLCFVEEHLFKSKVQKFTCIIYGPRRAKMCFRVYADREAHISLRMRAS